jgi:hypothetical protein
MRGGWAVVLMVLLAVSEAAPYEAAHVCCVADGQHSCCRPMAQMLADCCGSQVDLNAVVAEAQQAGAIPARAFPQAGMAVWAATNATGILSVTQQPPEQHAPPIILRI